MRDEIMCRVDEDGSLALYDPYATIECETKEDFDHLVEMVELAESIVRCKDCKSFEDCIDPPMCLMWASWTEPGGWCHKGERRSDDGEGVVR